MITVYRYHRYYSTAIKPDKAKRERKIRGKLEAWELQMTGIYAIFLQVRFNAYGSQIPSLSDIKA